MTAVPDVETMPCGDATHTLTNRAGTTLCSRCGATWAALDALARTLDPTTTPPAPHPCTDCGRATVSERTWRHATPSQRAAWKADGVVRCYGKRRCGKCNSRFYRQAAS